ncbi:hypothetical protein RHGRI_014892 [Rhododendron griersonianum]|uniref:Uncharacterized protein n=1 Tax=Rhododendron griersonianum TaxID=479676 RepID=A0AAV6KB74_9ERIC|nr:hypothetical protein RHGRI_014892 [Rhododendron griersonianum]
MMDPREFGLGLGVRKITAGEEGGCGEARISSDGGGGEARTKKIMCEGGRENRGLDLNTESISGGLNDSSSLFGLKFLEKLNLANNGFNFAEIPSSFGVLTNLKYLNLSGTQFVGQIPMEFSRLTRLVKLDLSKHYVFDSYGIRIDNPNLFKLFRNLGGLTELYLDGKKRAPTYTEGPSEKRQKGVRLPKIGFSAEEWLSPLEQDFIFEPTGPGLNAPLQIREPTEAEMSRRNIPRPSIPTKSANPARGRGTDQQQQQQKKQKLSDEVPPPSASKTAPSETRRPPPQKDQGRQTEGPVDLEGGPSEAEVLRPFSPTYTTADGRVLMLKDSVKEEPNLAVTLLRGLALPRDCDQLPTELIPGLGDMCSHLVQAGQAALKAYDRVKVTAERERLKKELAEAKAAAATAEADMEKMRGEEKKKLDEADAKGYEAGIKRAALEYTQTAHQMVNDALEERLPEFFELGYAAGAEAMADVLVVETDNKFRQQLPPPAIRDDGSGIVRTLLQKTGLDLNTESISGGLNDSSSLFGLKFLEKLNLANNGFNFAEIPSSFGVLTNLKYLNLSGTQFVGQIPMEFSRLTRLVKLDLSKHYVFDSYGIRIDNPNLFKLFRNLGGLTELYLDGKKRAPTYTEGPSEKRQKGVRLPKIGFSAEEWLSPLGQDFIFEPTGPGLNAPLQIREPTEAEMSRRNIPRPSIPTKNANPARGRGTDQQQQQQKKQKLSDEVPPPSASKTAPSETRRPPPQKDQGDHMEGTRFNIWH